VRANKVSDPRRQRPKKEDQVRAVACDLHRHRG
jgi:hypothetical protein